MTSLPFGFCLPHKLKKYFLLKKRIKRNEGYRGHAYLDQLGNPTIGYGHLILSKEINLLKNKHTKNYLNKIFELDFNKAVNQFNLNYRKNKFKKNIEEVLIEMIFQLGIIGQKKFHKMLRYLKIRKYYMAAFEMKNSLWYKQTPKRVDLLIKHLLSYDR